MRHFITSILFIAVSLSTPLFAQPEEPVQKAVLITGATTGIGRSMAELMASEGHFVYAGARKDKDMAELNAIENIQAVRLDVTDQAQIDAAVKTIEAGGRGLYGLINNAGVGVIYPLIEAPESEFDFQMDVNLYGPYRVTRAFAPMIIESKGRISTTGSISGILSGPLFGVYSMSKHAMEAFTDSLAAEMERFDVKVSIIEPGNYESKIGDTLVERMKSRGFDSENSRYKDNFDRMMAYMEGDREPEADPIAVAQAAMHAMFDENPKRRYMVVPNERQADITIRKAIEEVVQLNQGQEYSYSRDELVKMLEESMASHPWPMAAAADDGCNEAGDYAFVCGLKNPEDLVLVPGTHWIIASGMAADASLFLIDAEQKTWTGLYPAEAPRVEQDMQTFGACPGAPAAERFVSHGLNLRPGADGHSTLYVVGHGGREAIEVFDVNANGEAPVLTWIGCVMTPDGMEANSVASADDGSLLATIPLHTGMTISDALAGTSTGGVYRWSPGDTGFTLVQGTEMPYANGIEVSADGAEFYVASSGLFTVTAFSNSNPASLLRSTGPLTFIPDNLHRGPDGSLITAGLNIEDPGCGRVSQSQEFDLEEFAGCPRPFTVLAIDPESMQGETLASGPANQKFSNITMALPVGEELWIGSFAGDRIAYRSLR